MFTILLFILIVTAILGVYLISYVVKNKNTPKGIAIIHGGLGWVGIAILAIYSFYHPLNFISLGVLVAAALGGLLLFILDILGKKLPKIFVLSHGLVALMGIALLLIFSARH
ncbi:MAG: hypothetical protein H0U70_09510 [Tatlockia sp.]|nr:hypothetical protein [Tatlockia sp.]